VIKLTADLGSGRRDERRSAAAGLQDAGGSGRSPEPGVTQRGPPPPPDHPEVCRTPPQDPV